jgi:mRNA interferase RelE/StbE
VAKYELRFSRAAIKEADKLPSNVAERIAPAIDALADNPRPIGCQKLQGEDDLWRIRVGDYRVIYQVDARSRILYIRRVRHRREAYRRI